MHTLVLAHEADWEGFRRQARWALAAGCPPEGVCWQVGQGGGDLLSPLAEQARPGGPSVDGREGEVPSAVHVPSTFVECCRRAVLHEDPSRFALLYRLLWRLAREPAFRHDVLDADMQRARQMARAVQRDMHKMKAFVRFRALAPEGPFVAWFEPSHHIVQAMGPFFSRRFANMRWAILTPKGSLHWDGEHLDVGPPARREDAPADDAHEGLWLTYYEHIFNPARLKLKAMGKEMPRKYWRNLPEARLIPKLAAQAAARADAMIDRGPGPGHGKWFPPEPMQEQAVVAAPRIIALHPAQRPAAARQLASEAAGCQACALSRHATQTVWGEGALHAALMLVGEQPGDQEDLLGRPFVGPAGRLLDRAMAELGWAREALYITNAVKHFKYEMRGARRLHKTPGQQEALACAHWLEQEIELVQPRALIALGATAARSLLQRPAAVMSERGRWQQRPDGRQVLVTLHPSALLRMPPAEFASAYGSWLDDLRKAQGLWVVPGGIEPALLARHP